MRPFYTPHMDVKYRCHMFFIRFNGVVVWWSSTVCKRRRIKLTCFFFFFNPNFVRLQFGLSQSGVKDEETFLEHSNGILNVTLKNQKESKESLITITWGEPWILLFCFINDPISEKKGSVLLSMICH